MAAPVDPGDVVTATSISSAAANLRWQRLYAALGAGAIDDTQIASALLDKVGVTSGATVRRGKSIIAGTHSTASAAYTTLGTPDQVAGIVLPTDGLIFVAYQALWQSSVGSSGRAAIFIGATQLKVTGNGGGFPAVQEANGNATAATDAGLSTSSAANGLIGNNGAAPGADVTTGQVVGNGSTGFGGGPVAIFAAAGTYTVSIQFKVVSGGTVQATNRKLWVWTMGF